MTQAVTETNLLRFLPQPRIVAIDNKQEELDMVWKGLSRLGLPCIPIHYDEMEGLKKPDYWRPERLRIIFLDLNLIDIENPGGSLSRVVEPIAEVLKELAPTGPYLLIFWTKHKTLVEETMRFLAERNPDTPFPAAYTVLDKAHILANPEPDTLIEAIIEALSSNQLFLAMLAWESEVKGAAVRTFNWVHGLVAAIQPDGVAQKDQDLRDVLKNLAVAAWGRHNAAANPGAAATSGLSPLLLDHLDSITGNEEYTRVWAGAVPGGWNRKLPAVVPAARLNAQCLTDLSCKDSGCRGAWLEFTPSFFRRRTLLKGLFGITRAELAEEFINPGIAKSRADNIRKSVHLGLLECTAACDFSQNKAPLRRYILCTRIPSNQIQNVKWEEKGLIRTKKHDAIYEIGAIEIERQEFELFLDFRFSPHLPVNHLPAPELVNPAFRIRSQVLNDIAAKYAAHTTRPGTFAFPSKRRTSGA